MQHRHAGLRCSRISSQDYALVSHRLCRFRRRFITGNIATLVFAGLGPPHKSNTNTTTTLVCHLFCRFRHLHHKDKSDFYFFTMATNALLMARAPQLQQPNKIYTFLAKRSLWSSLLRTRNFTTRSALLPPDVPRLAETARISLTPQEVEDFAPKIRQVIDWFGQLQAVDLESIEPALRADTEGDSLRQDVPETFENREAIIAAIPSYEEPYLKVPRVLNKD